MMGSLLAYECDFRSLWTRFESALGSLWDTLGSLRVHFGTLWGHLRNHVGPIWGYFAHFGLTLRSLWVYEGRFRVTLVRFQKTLTFPKILMILCSRAITLDPFLGHFGLTFGIRGHVRVTFGSLWNHFGVTLGLLLAYEGDFGPLWGHSGVTFGV